MPEWTLTSLGEIDYLPPGTKVTVGQYLYISPNRRFWAILVIGAFYDSDENELWRKEIFVRKCDTRGGQNTWPEQFDTGSAPPAFALAGKLCCRIFSPSYCFHARNTSFLTH